MSRTFNLNELEVPALRTVPDATARRAMPRIVEVVRDRAEANAPKRRGKLRKGIKGKVLRGGTAGAVQATARHAHLVHDGTKAHDIAPREKRVLRIPSGGQWNFRPAARHFGTDPQPFLDEARDQTRDQVAGILAAEALAGIGAVV